MFSEVARRLAVAFGVMAMLLTVRATAGAQGYPGGRGGMGGRRGGGGGYRGAGGDEAKRFEQMASLKDVMKHVDGLNKTQKDSLKHLESWYKDQFKAYGKAASQLFDSARTADGGGRPDMEEMRRLRADAEKLRQDELASARGLLTTDAQRSRFDANVDELKQKARQQEEDRRGRRRDRGPRAGPPGR